MKMNRLVLTLCCIAITSLNGAIVDAQIPENPSGIQQTGWNRGGSYRYVPAQPTPVVAAATQAQAAARPAANGENPAPAVAVQHVPPQAGVQAPPIPDQPTCGTRSYKAPVPHRPAYTSHAGCGNPACVNPSCKHSINAQPPCGHQACGHQACGQVSCGHQACGHPACGHQHCGQVLGGQALGGQVPCSQPTACAHHGSDRLPCGQPAHLYPICGDENCNNPQCLQPPCGHPLCMTQLCGRSLCGQEGCCEYQCGQPNCQRCLESGMVCPFNCGVPGCAHRQRLFPCPHGHAHCPGHLGNGFGLFRRHHPGHGQTIGEFYGFGFERPDWWFLHPPTQPIFGLNPLVPPGMPRNCGTGPLARKLLGGHPVANVAPEPPLPTYTVRGPRDFFLADPPSIGY